MDNRIPDILDECIEAVLREGVDVDAACARYPGHEAELRPLVELALDSRAALEVEVSAEALERTRARVMAGVGDIARRRQLEQDTVAIRPKRRLLRFKPVAWVSLALMLLIGGTALAAAGAGPDSFLYPLKQRMEEARTGLAWKKLDKAKTEVGYANRRLDEVSAMMDRDKPELVPDLLYRYDLHMEKAMRYADEAAADGEDASEVYAMIDDTRERHDRMLDDIFDRLPEDVRERVFGNDEGGRDSDDDGIEDGDDGPASGGPGSDDSESGDDGHVPPSGGEPGGQDDDGYDDDGYEGGPGGSVPGGGSSEGGGGDSPEDGGDGGGDAGDHGSDNPSGSGYQPPPPDNESAAAADAADGEHD